MQAQVLHSNGDYRFKDLPKNAKYSGSLLRLVFTHKGEGVGSVVVELGVFGWLQSEYPMYKDGKIELSIKFQALEAPNSKVSPAFLGARSQVVIRGLVKEIR